MPVDLKEEETGSLAFPTPVPAGATSVTFAVTTTTGVGPSGPATLDMPTSSQ